jgi:NTP pyrophosphatase (non-canonical NTP hydrolase)
MTPNEYQDKAVTFKLPSYTLEAIFAGLASEAGEVMGVRQKFLRDADKQSDPEYVAYLCKLEKELGDLLWHIAALSQYYGISLEEIMAENIDKLTDRAARKKIGGSGDFR